MRAVEWAAKESRLRGAALRIVSVAESLPRMAGPLAGTGTDGTADAIRRDALRSLDAAAKRAAQVAPGVLTGTDVLTGPTAVAVADCGASAQLLVVGCRGRGVFTALVLGSVSRYAATHAACPAVVVREQTLAAGRQVVVGIRDTQDCDAALRFAFEEAEMRQASLLAVYAWQTPFPPARPGPGDAPVPQSHAIEARSAEALAELLATWQAKYPDVAVEQDVVHGHPGHVLATFSSRANLVVLGRHGEHDVARIAHAVLSHAHGPVATVPLT